MVSNAFAGRFSLKFLPQIFSVSLACLSVVGLAQAQGISAAQLMKLQQMHGESSSTEETTPRQVVVQPAAGAVSHRLSDLERFYSKRAGFAMREFGYDQLGQGKPVVLTQVGGIVNNYVLGVDDEIVVSLRGQENNEYRVKVNRAGQVILPRMAPVAAAGRTFADFRADLDAAIHRAYVSTQAFISIGQLRQINVMVSGQVHAPGMRSLTGLSTVVDAILLSGGIRKDGSLRNVEIQRNGRLIHVDLYSVLTSDGTKAKLSLQDGDRIIVPSVGSTFAISGDVHHRGIFELPEGRNAVSLRQALSLAGNTLVPGVYRISLLRQDKNGKPQLTDITGQANAAIHSGDVVSVEMVSDVAVNQISLRGAVLSPGVFSLQKYKTLHDMLPSADVFTHDAYMLFGYIDRINHVTHVHQMVPFSPKHVVEGRENIRLQGDDRVVVFSQKDEQSTVRDVMRHVQAQMAFDKTGNRSLLEKHSLSRNMLASGKAAQVLGYHANTTKGSQRGTLADTSSNSAANQILGQADASVAQATAAQTSQIAAESGLAIPTNSIPSGNASAANLTGSSAANSPQSVLQADDDSGVNAAQSMREAPLTLDQKLNLMAVYYRVSIEGAVTSPGIYLIAPGTNLAEAIGAASGLRPDADRSNVEITSSKLNSAAGVSATSRKDYSLSDSVTADHIMLQPRDSIVFHKIYTNRSGGTVSVLGQVRYPGTYNLLRGERLSSVLMRAGGLTASAYPYGTVFLRPSVAALETAAHKREAKQLESLLVVAMTRFSSDSQMDGKSFTALQTFVQQVANEKSLGRMTVSADPAALAANPEDDPVLESGDQIIIPKRPFTVSIMGEVLQPTSVPYKKGLTADDYIHQAGGFTQVADDDEVYVVFPDGSAYRADQGWFGLGERSIPPGSMVYVGRDMSGYDLRQGVIDVSKIFAQMATSLAAIAVLSDND